MSTRDPRGPGPAPGANPCTEEHPRLMSLLADALTDGDVFLDVGANTGYFAVPIAKALGGEGTVLAFEPAADAAHRLRSKARTQGVLSRIRIYEMALGRDAGSAVLRADPGHPEDSTKRSLFVDGPVVTQIPVHSFDGLVASGDVVLPGGLHAVKIDVEGAEMHVLAGMRRALARYRPRIVVVETIEGHLRRAGSSVADVHTFMHDLGYVATDDGGDVPLELNAVYVRA